MTCVCLCAENVATLFRASTLATMLMDQLMKLTAMDYLHSVLREPIQRIADLRDSCEVGVVDAVNVIFYASVSKLYSTARNLCVVYIIMPVRLSFASTAYLHTYIASAILFTCKSELLSVPACKEEGIPLSFVPLPFQLVSVNVSTLFLRYVTILNLCLVLHLSPPSPPFVSLSLSHQLDPSKLPRGTDLTPHLHLMEVQLQNILVSIFTSVDSCPLYVCMCT